MADRILLNTSEYHFEESELPLLVTYEEKSGGSHFSVALVADLFQSGSKIVLLTAYPMAKDNFLKQIGVDHSNVAFVSTKDQIKAAVSVQAIILESGNEALFLEAAQQLSDFAERVVLVKNIERFSQAVFDVCLALPKVILSGHLDECGSQKAVMGKSFKTIIAFNKPNAKLPFEVPSLKKYVGYLFSENKKGFVSVQV